MNLKEYVPDIPFFVILIIASITLYTTHGAKPSTMPRLEWCILLVLTGFILGEYVKGHILAKKVIALTQPATLSVQLDRRSNYERGARILSGADRSDTVILSFLEHSSMWRHPNDDEDKRFDEALQNAIRVGQCTVHHIIRCDAQEDLTMIADYVRQFSEDRNYFAYLITQIPENFPPVDLLVVLDKVGQLEFPQQEGQPSLMGPSVEMTEPEALKILDRYATILRTKSMLVKNAHGVDEVKFSTILGELLNRERTD